MTLNRSHLIAQLKAFFSLSLGIGLLFSYALVVAKQENSSDIFEKILPTLQEKCDVPPRLPNYLGAEDSTDDDGNPLATYATLEEVTADRYEIEIAFDPECHTASACHHGTLTGEVAKKKPKLQGKQVKLSGDVTGYFIDAECGSSCSDSVLSWEQDGYRYSVGTKAGNQESLIKMANSAIDD